MQRKGVRLSGAIACFLCAMVPACAQTGEVQTLRVELKGIADLVTPQYTLVLYDFHNHQKLDGAELNSDGVFTLRHVPYGDYQLTVADQGGSVVYQEFLNLSGTTPSIAIQLPGSRPRQLPGGPVSVQQLRHPPNRKAFQAMVAAQKFSEAGNYEKAAGELEKAIQLSPYYADAYTNLAAQHIRMGRYREASGELARALDIGGPNPVVLTNLASMQLAVKQVAEAEKYARAALHLDAGYAQAHYILGIALSMDTRTVSEGLVHLQTAALTLPGAQAQIERVRQALSTR